MLSSKKKILVLLIFIIFIGITSFWLINYQFTQSQNEKLISEDETVTFAIIGDYGSDGPDELDVANLVKSWNPDFIITTGDNNYMGGSTSTIDQNIGKYYHEFIGNYQGDYGEGSSINRFFPSLGNHDWMDWQEDNMTMAYFDYFTLPGNERYYDFVWNPVHFFAIDSEPYGPGDKVASVAQEKWLQSKLSTSESPFKIVYMHHPPHPSGKEIPRIDWPFKDWGASVVLSGHTHVYERMVFDDFPHVINGLGGKSVDKFLLNATSYSQIRYNEDFGAMLVIANSESMTFKFISRSGQLIDTFVIENDRIP